MLEWSGTRTWSLNIRDSKGVRRRFDVGANLGLSEARRKAEKLRKAVRDGADPTSERRAGRQRAQAATQAELIKVDRKIEQLVDRIVGSASANSPEFIAQAVRYLRLRL
jgi:hypothetical protein